MSVPLPSADREFVAEATDKFSRQAVAAELTIVP